MLAFWAGSSLPTPENLTGRATALGTQGMLV